MARMFNIAVVGCGYWGPNLVRNFSSVPDCKVKKACDLDTNRLSYIRSLYPTVETTTHFEEVLDDGEVDGIAIATPVYTHFKLAQGSLKAGKHTYIEKPMASSSAECQALNELAAKQKRKLFVGHTFIYSAPVRMMKEIVESGHLGEIYYISSQRLNLGLFQKDINVTWDLAPHDISIILHLLGQNPIAVACHGKAHVNMEIEDITTTTIEFPDRKIAIIQSSWLDPNKIRKMTIVGSKRMLVYDDNEPLEKIKIYDKHVEVPPHYDTFAEFHYAYHYGDVHSPYIKQAEPLKVQCQHFLDCIRTDAKPDSSGVEGLQVVQILEAASISLKNGGAKVAISEQQLPNSASLYLSGDGRLKLNKPLKNLESEKLREMHERRGVQ